ncbi:hypothetical protein WDZ92_52830 [Nostoc sp. NIES-2111]
MLFQSASSSSAPLSASKRSTTIDPGGRCESTPSTVPDNVAISVETTITRSSIACVTSRKYPPNS